MGPTTKPADARARRPLGGGGAWRSWAVALLEPGRVTSLELVALVTLALAFVVAAAWVSRVPWMLGHDESVYAVVARHWVSGAPDTGTSAHRAPLLSVLGAPVLALGGGELALRTWGIVAGVGALLAVWWLGRLVRGPITGLGAAAVFALAPSVLRAGTQYLTDLPAAALLVALAALLWQQFGVRDAPDRRLLLAAPLSWAAYELRYGSALVVVVLFATTLALFGPKLRGSWRLVGSTLGLLLVLLTPHLILSTIELGTPWGRVVYTSEVAGRAYLGEGLVQYVRWFPSRLAGPLAAVVMTAGLVGALVGLVLRRRGVERIGATPPVVTDPRAMVFLLVPALVHTVAIGIASHGEPRFVFFAVALLCVAGAVAVADALQWLGRRSTTALLVAFSVAAGLVAAQTALVAREVSRDRASSAADDDGMLLPARALADLGGEDCSVLTSYTPQITWYTGCASYHFGQPPVAGEEQHLTDDGWMLLFEEGKRQPQGAVLEAYLAVATPVQEWDLSWSGEFGSARLYRMRGGS